MMSRISAAAAGVALAGFAAPLVGQGTPMPQPLSGLASDSGHRSTPPQLAFTRGLMPLHSTGVDRFATDHPTWDGRGVLIAILDSGIDPGIAGLLTTSDGSPKILDLRDFSHEGHVTLRPVERRGDTLLVAGKKLLGAAHVAAAGRGTILGGALYELPLGTAPEADIDGNGVVGDTLPVVVVRGADGWVLFADTQENGTLADDKPIHDYAIAREYFGWSAGRHAPQVDVAVNLSEGADGPSLDLFFDTSSHGSHVTGIAAGHDIYGVAGFNGVAPGAQVIGMKISNDAGGGITVSGSMIRALDYAIRFAEDRGLPLVVNMSFGVGNEIEGTAHIDRLIDSVLALHPNVVMTIAASNDGPALSTIGFPASASRVIAIGATAPLVFAGLTTADTNAEPLATFSSRGGEVAAPDIVVPGTAYSTIPNFAIGDEQEDGTSMASPHAAGLAARLLSALKAEGRTASAYQVRQALRNGAHLLPSALPIEQGAGEPDLSAAWKWLSTGHAVPELAVDVGAVHGRGAVYDLTGAVSGAAARGGDSVTLRRLDGTASLTLHLASAAPWVTVPATVTLANGRATFAVKATAPAVGVASAMIRVDGPDTTSGPLAMIPVTVATPVITDGRFGDTIGVAIQTVGMTAGGTSHIFVAGDTGRGMQIQIATLHTDDHVMAMLHEPSGMPFRDGPEVPAGAGDAAAMFDLGGNDVVPGVYEVDVAAGPLAGDSARVTVRRAPVRLGASLSHDTLTVSAQSVVATPTTVRFRAGLIGAERQLTVRRTDDTPVRLAIAVPSWAAHVTVDTRMPRAEWSRYTDFGVTFEDRTGRELSASPINYAFSRAAPDLPAKLPGDSLIILLSPGFATPAADGPWALDLTIRFYVTKAVLLDGGGSPPRTVAAGASFAEPFAGARIPVDLAPEWQPVIIAVALEGEQHVWTRELPVARPGSAPR